MSSSCARMRRSADHKQLGNWDVLGLGGTGSIDYAAEDVFIAEDLVFPILTAPPQRLKELFSLGVVGLAAIGHTGWALGQGRRMLDEIAKFARSKSGRAGLIGESEKFWYDYGRAEARYPLPPAPSSSRPGATSRPPSRPAPASRRGRSASSISRSPRSTRPASTSATSPISASGGAGLQGEASSSAPSAR